MKNLLFFLGVLFITNTISAQNTSESAEQNSISLVRSGEEKADKGDWNGAINDYTTAIIQNEKNAVAYFDRAKALYNLKDYRGAFADYSKSINVDAGKSSSFIPAAYYGRGMCLYTMGMKEKACLEFTKASGLGSSEATEAIQNWCN